MSKTCLAGKRVDHDTANQAIEQMELTGLAHRSLDTFSGGERQRARIALLLAQSPFCYLLDEPLQYLDLRHQLAVMTLFQELARQGKARCDGAARYWLGQPFLRSRSHAVR